MSILRLRGCALIIAENGGMLVHRKGLDELLTAGA